MKKLSNEEIHRIYDRDRIVYPEFAWMILCLIDEPYVKNHMEDEDHEKLYRDYQDRRNKYQQAA